MVVPYQFLFGYELIFHLKKRHVALRNFRGKMAYYGSAIG
jgi:hypothetical protein